MSERKLAEVECVSMGESRIKGDPEGGRVTIIIYLGKSTMKYILIFSNQTFNIVFLRQLKNWFPKITALKYQLDTSTHCTIYSMSRDLISVSPDANTMCSTGCYAVRSQGFNIYSINSFHTEKIQY